MYGGNIATIEKRMIGYEWRLHALNDDNTYTGESLGYGMSRTMFEAQKDAQEELLALGLQQLPERLTSML